MLAFDQLLFDGVISVIRFVILFRFAIATASFGSIPISRSTVLTTGNKVKTLLIRQSAFSATVAVLHNDLFAF